jgi:ubiquinone/menaquinone biosynthesis C-methylase UbiE
MDPKSLYSNKAEKYARYRWDYSPEAIEAIFKIAGLGPKSRVADIGAGTGNLSHHFAGKVRRLYAIEPNSEMRRLAAGLLTVPGCQVIDASAEATGLRKKSIDLITAAQAMHWFDPEPTRREFRRILKPTGWLAFLRNYGSDSRLNEAIGALSSESYGANPHAFEELPHSKPASFYFDRRPFRKFTFPFVIRSDWETFFGGLTSASYMPDNTHPLYGHLEKAAQEVFERFSTAGTLHIKVETELIIGRM